MGFRGVTPEILLSHVRNTIPFLFEGREEWVRRAPHVAPLLSGGDFSGQIEYFRLCLAAHHATVSSFVPTDVDNQIRLHLWQGASPETVKAMAELVLESRTWDYRPLSPRWIETASGRLSGHAGEWLSTAVAAYGALRKRAPEDAARMAAEIESELKLEAAVFDDLARNRDGMGLIVATPLIAHNLGDFNRVKEMWSIADDPALDFDILRGRTLRCAAELNKVKTAAENHRHFALRKPRCLRASVDFLIGMGPFYDDWGLRLTRHPLLTPENLAEIAGALIEGLERTPGSVGYTRALAGIEQGFRGGPQALQNHLPARDAKKLKAGPLRSLISVRREPFEQQWSQFALQFCKTFT